MIDLSKQTLETHYVGLYILADNSFEMSSCFLGQKRESEAVCGKLLISTMHAI